MTTEEKLDKLTDVVVGLGHTVTGLTAVVGTLASSIAAHDDQIEALIKISEDNAREWQQLRKEFQAYLNTLPKQ